MCIIEIENPNLVKLKTLKLEILMEEIEKQKAHEQFMRLQKQGKTEQARKDLDILYYSWSPAMTISSICIIILSMLSSSTTKVDTQRSYSQAELDEMQVELADFLGLYV
ncbi:uncharacterized protein LOC103499968 isoform X2 [Cucumis melo]|uniref:Uncharacterized protein LOC103499968 isoform X2 n=1 Tax=Cucumis melo TaxID=3656 RepID=A0ABM3KDN6_CUCME|nr:uncharacterized protein LOC103499968 isoform X2 [Cucumis melo]